MPTVFAVSTARGYQGTSNSSNSIGTGTKTFTVAQDLAYSKGARVRTSSNGLPNDWMEGTVTSYSGTTLQVSMDNTNAPDGVGPYSDWNINLAGTPGDDGAAGATGPVGPAGPIGPQGIQGIPGATGAAGLNAGSGLGGDASDGNVTFDGTATYPLFATTTGSAPNLIYTLTRDVFALAFVVNTGKVVNTKNFRIFGAASVTINGTVQNNGGNGNAQIGGNHAQVSNGAGLPAAWPATLAASGANGTSGTAGAGANGAAGSTGGGSGSVLYLVTGTGSAGGGPGGTGASSGANTGGTGGGGGTGGTALTATTSPPREPLSASAGRSSIFAASSLPFIASPLSGTGGAGGAGAGDGTNFGGNGGAGGGAGGAAGNILISTPTLTINSGGVVSCNGGTGGNGSNGLPGGLTGNTGGGGGGAGGSGGPGGVLMLMYNAITNNGSLQANGGAGGTGGSPGANRGTATGGTSGANGLTGQPGIVIQIPLGAALAGGGGGQSPWLSNIDGNSKVLYNVAQIGIGRATAAAVGYPLDVVGDINCTGQFRINGTPFTGGFWTAGSGGAIYYNGGNVGIGTSSPSQVVHVAPSGADALILVDTPSGFDAALTIRKPASIVWNVGIDSRGTNLTFAAGGSFNNLRTTPLVTMTNVGYVGIGNTGTDSGPGSGFTQLIVGPQSAGSGCGILALCQNATSASAPIGQIAFCNYAVAGVDKRIATITGLLQATNTCDLQFSTYNAGSTVEKVRIKASGIVGIGNDASVLPHVDVSYFHLIHGRTDGASGTPSEITLCTNVAYTSGNPIGILSFANYNIGITEKRIAQITANLDGSGNSGALNFYSVNTSGVMGNRMQIAGSGYVGIGLTGPACALDIAGDLHLYNSGAAGSWIYFGSSLTQAKIAYDNNNSKMNFWMPSMGAPTMVFSGVSVAIGGLLTPSYNLHLYADSAAKPTSTTWTVASDMRTKRNVTPLVGGLDIIRRIEPLVAEYNGLANTPEGARVVSVDTTKIEQILPHTVSKYKGKLRSGDQDETDIYGFNPHEILFHLILAVQQLAKKLEEK